ncbi:MAG TPA: hypothetical protein VGC65_06025 [Bacteroidia bacterium]|jgi:hypothetical protein
MEKKTEQLFELTEQQCLKWLSSEVNNAGDMPDKPKIEKIKFKRKSISHVLDGNSDPHYDVCLELYIEGHDSFKGKYNLIMDTNLKFVDESLVW